MRKLNLIILCTLAFAVLMIPIASNLSAAIPMQHKGPFPFPPNLIPHIDPSNHNHLVKKNVVPKPNTLP